MTGTFRLWAGMVAVRAGVVAACLGFSIVPAFNLAWMFAAKGYFLPCLSAAWVGILLGPFCLPVLYHVPTPLGAAGLILILFMIAHPIRPGRLTRYLTILGFILWYLAAWATIGNQEAPV